MKNIQKKIKEFCGQHNLESSPEHHLLDTVSELGELAKEVLKMSEYGKKTPEFRKEAASELGDTLYSLIRVANSLDVDLEEALEEALAKYRKRLEKGRAGSESEDVHSEKEQKPRVV